jgi:hypothetical protein
MSEVQLCHLLRAQNSKESASQRSAGVLGESATGVAARDLQLGHSRRCGSFRSGVAATGLDFLGPATPCRLRQQVGFLSSRGFHVVPQPVPRSAKSYRQR